METWDVIVIGAGAAGMMTAIQSSKRGRRTLMLEKNARPGKKILISGGGRCNFTNVNADFENYVSKKPKAIKFAMSSYRPKDFIGWVEKHRIAYHEKHLGQLFTDQSSKLVVQMLLKELEEAGAILRTEAEVETVQKSEGKFRLRVGDEEWEASSVVIACGGLSFPKLGISDLAYRVAASFDLKVEPTEPALVPFILGDPFRSACQELAGVSLPVKIRTKNHLKKKIEFEEDLLFTHKGLSGPAILQISLHWQVGGEVFINLVPGEPSLSEALTAKKRETSSRQLETTLKNWLPSRAAQMMAEVNGFDPSQRLKDLKDKDLRRLGERLQNWSFVPPQTEGYAKAEVTRGGLSVDELNDRTLEVKNVPGLYYVGEAVDVTGWLGGYNLQWAWASGHLVGLHC